MRALPALTVDLARKRSRSLQRRALLWLLGAYLGAFQVGLFVAWDQGHQPSYADGRSRGASARVQAPPMPPSLPLGAAGLALVLGLFHYAKARRVRLNTFLDRLGPQSGLDSLDAQRARQMENVVEEARLAAGLNKLKPVLLESDSVNAFAVQDFKGDAALGMTRGAVEKLSRSELEAVAAQQAAKIAYGQGSLHLTVTSLAGVFLAMLRLGRNKGRMSATRAVAISTVGFAAAVTGAAGRLAMRVMSALLSRILVLDADAAAVGLCKNPAALSSALGKASAGGVPEAAAEYACLFLVSPAPGVPESSQGGWAEVVSTHPPLKKRDEQLEALRLAGVLKDESDDALAAQLNDFMLRGSTAFFRGRAESGHPAWQALFLLACFPLFLITAFLAYMQWDKELFAVGDEAILRRLQLGAVTLVFGLCWLASLRLWLISLSAAKRRKAGP